MSFFRSKPKTMANVKASNNFMAQEPQQYYVPGPTKSSQNVYSPNTVNGPVRYVPTNANYYRDAQFVQPPVAAYQQTISRREPLPMSVSQHAHYMPPPTVRVVDRNWPGSVPTMRRAPIPFNSTSQQQTYMTLPKQPMPTRSSIPIEFMPPPPPHTHSRRTVLYAPNTKMLAPVHVNTPPPTFVPIQRPVERAGTVKQLKPLEMKESQAIIWNPRKFDEFQSASHKSTMRMEPDRIHSPSRAFTPTLPYEDFKPKIVTEDARLDKSSSSSRGHSPPQIYDSSQVF